MEQLFGAIPAVLGGLEPNEKIGEAVVFAAWSRCAGEALRERTVPVEFVRKRLIVAVSDRMWQRHLEELSPQMLATINRSVGQGSLKFIEFRIDELAINSAHKKHVSKGDSESNVVTPSLARAAKAIADENLRNSFLEAAGGYLAKQKLSNFEL